jgi:hypothetical protein
MKVKITATVTYETDLEPEWYEGIADGPKTDDEIITWETQQATSDDLDADDTLLDALMTEGEIADFKIEKIEEAASAQERAA